VNLEKTENFAVLWTKACPKVAAYIGAIVRDYHQAEEILHQVAATLVRKFDEYDERSSLTAWAIGIARIKILDHRRKCAKDPHIFTDEVLEVIGEEFSRVADEYDARRSALRTCLQALGGRMKRVLELRYTEDLRAAAIAARLKTSSSAISVTLNRAKNALRDCIQRRMEQGEV
jgi:RNA polymerase sigma-70 factor (ECF subfamily)